jgi:hypothetical protein
MINKANWYQTVQNVLTLIRDVDTFNAGTNPCHHFRLNPLEMLLVLDVLHNVQADPKCQWSEPDPEMQTFLASIKDVMQRYHEYALWLGKLPGRNYPTVVRRLERVQADFKQRCEYDTALGNLT